MAGASVAPVSDTPAPPNEHRSLEKPTRSVLETFVSAESDGLLPTRLHIDNYISSGVLNNLLHLMAFRQPAGHHL